MKWLSSALQAIVFTVALGLQSAAAEEKKPEKLIPGDFSANVAVTSNYIFRGISQTDNIPAVQGGFDYDVGLFEKIKAYAGIWASNVNFSDGDQAQVELDVYFGLKGSIDKFSWSVGGLYYAYPGAARRLNYNFWEITGSAGYDFGFAELTVGVNYSPDYFASSGDAFYLQGTLKVPIPIEEAKPYAPYFAFHIGRQWIERNAAFGAPDYTDWSVALGGTVLGFGLEVKYTDTSLSRGKCFGGTSYCGAKAVFTVSRSF